MKDRIAKHLAKTQVLEDIEKHTIELFETTRSVDGYDQIGYVAGLITSDGPEHIQKNIRILTEHTDRLSILHPFPIFSATYIFTPEIFERFQILSMPEKESHAYCIPFWRNILGSGHITDVFFTPDGMNQMARRTNTKRQLDSVCESIMFRL